ncbi:MAG: HAD family hydrolase [Pirellulales bacterium]|nr:HAD family hydrolase [Pirellulales bacterium]
MSRWQAIVFDLDDTLYPERDYVLSGMRAVAAWAEAELGWPRKRSFAELQGLFEQGVRGDTFNRWLAGRGLPPDGRITSMVRVYRWHEPAIRLQPAVRHLLEHLGRRHRLGLVTDGYLEVQRRKVSALGVRRYLSAVVFSDALGRDAWKPSPKPFEAVLRELQVPATEAVYVGDNPAKDFRGARAVGMGTIRVRLPRGEHRDLQPHGADDAPDAEIADLGELEDLLTDCAGGLPEAASRRGQPLAVRSPA